MLKISKGKKNAKLKIGKFEFVGSYSKNFLMYPDEDIILFSNESEHKEIRVEMFKIIQELKLSEIPKGVQFHLIPIMLNEPMPFPLMEIPFPFDSLTIGDDNKGNYFVRFDTCQDEIHHEDWKSKWGIKFYFQALKEYKNLDSEILIFEPSKNMFGEIYIQINLSKEYSVKKAFSYANKKLIELLNKIELKLSGLDKFLEVVNIWHKNKENRNEKFWQATLSKYSWILSQSFNSPLILFEKEAFLGGKSLSNIKGRIVDFVLKNKLSQNIALIEIKTPKTKIIGKKYRNVHTISAELTGSISQLLDYKEQLSKDFYSIYANTDSDFVVFNPKLLLVVGSLKLLTKDERKTFELFRSDLKSVEIITFDELFEKIFMTIELLNTTNNQSRKKIF
ncbi:Shedu immune nuclease family protein [uncultured Aquimarina sp.]|uniref:Shedu immune nuclease family protein n=1 Tax=uncultured Aquimarina sp. TaxID=575652 RepID=UPI002632AA97|nr:Shedu immune nuclease family protein [uncultured Aquimarina sp.]